MYASVDPRSAVRRLAWSRGFTVAGDFAGRTALVVEVFTRTHSTAWVSAAMLANLGLSGLVSPVSGWIADRFERRRVMLLAEFAGGVVWLTMALVASHISLVTLVGLNLLASVVNSPFHSASAAAIPNVAGPDLIDWANRLLSSGSGVALVIGPFAGGALAGTIGARGVYAINGVTFLISTAFIVATRGYFGGGHMAHQSSGLTTGLKVVAHSNVLQRLFLISILWETAFGLCIVADEPLADHFGAGGVGYALISTVWGLGSIAGSVWLARRYGQGREHVGLAIGAALMAFGIGGTAVPNRFVIIVLLQTIGGLGSGLVRSPWQSAVQRSTDDQSRGRVFALSSACDQMFLMLGFAVAGPLASWVGIRALYWWPGLAMLASGILAWTSHGQPVVEPTRASVASVST